MASKSRNIRDSVIYSWLGSYLSILLIPMIISGILYIQSVAIVKNQVNSINEAMIQQLQQTMDGQISNLEKISTQIAMNPKLISLQNNELATSDSDINFAYTERIKQLFQDFNIYTLSNSFIKGFYVFFHDSDIVLSSSGYYQSRDFYDSEFRTHKESYEDWRSSILKPYYNDYIVSSPSLNQNEKTITLMRSLPLQNTTFNATLALSINPNELSKLVNSVNWANQNMFFIVDKENHVLYGTQNIELPSFMHDEQMTDHHGFLYGTLQNKEVVATYIKSASGQWNYISLTQTSLFYERAAYIRNLTMVCLFLCILIGGAVAYWFTRKNYSPLYQLMQSISSNSGFRLEKGHKEYRFLSEAYSHAISEKKRSVLLLEQQMTAMRSNFITMLLKGRSGRVIPADELSKMYGISFDAPYFAVIVFYLDDYSQLMVHASDEENVRLAEFIIHNVTEEVLSSGQHRSFTTETDGLLACLMNLEDKNIHELYRDMEEAIITIQKLLFHKYQIHLTAAISEIHQTPQAIAEAYQESLEAIEYKLFRQSGSIIRFDTIKQTVSSPGAYHYSLETERILTNSIKSGDYTQAEQIVDEIFLKNFADGDTSLQIAKCLMFDLVGTMIKTMNELSSVYEPAFVDELNPVDRLLTCHNLNDLRYQITSILNKVCSVINENNKGKTQIKLKDSIVEFVQSHYADGNLNLTIIAEHVDLSTKYVSAFFKQSTGEGLNTFINRVRLSKAKELLSETSLTIAEVAEKVGYNNSNALIRAFNKHEGITLGQFRELDRT
ncbi:helix-turn-helix domain-containing protein [Paenibacillus sp. WLX2291]|uniref:helix-turn-helix domain-containing protein n=1 Tax=Paenibacillus sp. WLX2291 TaxID=3296934 RepID=UPI0039841FDC